MQAVVTSGTQVSFAPQLPTVPGRQQLSKASGSSRLCRLRNSIRPAEMRRCGARAVRRAACRPTLRPMHERQPAAVVKLQPSMVPACEGGAVSQVFPREWPNVGCTTVVACRISHSIRPAIASASGSCSLQVCASEAMTVSTIW